MDPARYDHRAASAAVNPFPELHELRARCPVARSELYGGSWIVTRYDDVHFVASDPITFSSRFGVPFPPNPFPPVPPIETDPPEHRQFRVPLLDWFSTRAVTRKEPFYRSVVSDLAGRCTGSTEVVGGLLQPLVGHVTAEMLGFPEADMEKLSFWAARIMENGDDLFTIVGEVFGYFSEVHADRVARPRDDIPSLLATLEINGRPIELGEFLGTMATLFVGGLDTTVSAGAYILEWLSQHPDAQEWLRADLDRVPAAVEEWLRYFTPLPTLRRVATAGATVNGQVIAEGDTVQLHFMAANHDPDRFPEPDRVILDRDPNRHVAFGSGIHRCLGSAVARQELRLLVEDLLTRFPFWELDEERPVVRYEGIVRGVRELWVRFPEPVER